MTNVFKKSLVALALASLSSGAMAATIVGTGSTAEKTVPLEYVSAAKKDPSKGLNFKASGFTVELKESAYTIRDKIFITFDSDAVVANTMPTKIEFVKGNDNVVEAGINGSRVVDGKTVFEYLVTQVASGSDSKGSVATFPGVVVNASKANEGGMLVEFRGELDGGNLIETTARPYNTYATKNVFENLLTQSVFEGEITAADRTNVLGSSTSPLEVYVEVTPKASILAKNSANADVYDAVKVTKAEYTLGGNFGWLMTGNSTVGYTIAANTLTTATAGCDAVPNKITPSSVTYACTAGANTVTAPGAGVAANFLIDADNTNRIHTPRLYKLSGKVFYEVANIKDTVEIDDVYAGQWTMSGETVSVGYMPYSPRITQIINVKNSSFLTSEIYVVAYDQDGVAHDLGLVDTVGPNAIAQIAGPIKSKLDDKGLLWSNTRRFTFDITTVSQSHGVIEANSTTPIADANVGAEVYSAYNVDGTGARLVVNSSNANN